MEQPLQIQEPATQSQVALHLVVNELSGGAIVNGIPGNLYVHADSHKLASVIGSLLHTMCTFSCGGPVLISAKKFSAVTLLHLKSDTHFYDAAFGRYMEKVRELANDLGGTAEVTSHQNDRTTVAITFVNSKHSA